MFSITGSSIIDAFNNSTKTLSFRVQREILFRWTLLQH